MQSSTKDLIDVTTISVAAFVLIFGIIFAKMEAYNGDASCFFIQCVKVIR